MSVKLGTNLKTLETRKIRKTKPCKGGKHEHAFLHSSGTRFYLLKCTVIEWNLPCNCQGSSASKVWSLKHVLTGDNLKNPGTYRALEEAGIYLHSRTMAYVLKRTGLGKEFCLKAKDQGPAMAEDSSMPSVKTMTYFMQWQDWEEAPGQGAMHEPLRGQKAWACCHPNLNCYKCLIYLYDCIHRATSTLRKSRKARAEGLSRRSSPREHPDVRFLFSLQ